MALFKSSHRELCAWVEYMLMAVRAHFEKYFPQNTLHEPVDKFFFCQNDYRFGQHNAQIDPEATWGLSYLYRPNSVSSFLQLLFKTQHFEIIFFNISKFSSNVNLTSLQTASFVLSIWL